MKGSLGLRLSDILGEGGGGGGDMMWRMVGLGLGYGWFGEFVSEEWANHSYCMFDIYCK